MIFNEVITALVNRELECNYFALIAMGALLIFMKTNKMFDRKIRRLFYSAIVSVFVAVIIDMLLIYFVYMTNSNFGATIFHSLKYIALPQIVFFLLLIVKRDFKNIDFLLWIPQIINIIISMSALFSTVAFTYNEMHQFVRGPIGFAPHIVGMFYQCCTIYETLRFFKERNYIEGLLLLYLMIGQMVAIVLDVIIDSRLAISASAVSVSFYYLYFQTQSQKRDSLTNAFSRQTFFMDAKKYRKEICALIGFDLNDLKLINDTQGHAAGDLALVTMAKVINDQLSLKCRLYRTGGDEFVALCRRQSEENVMAIVKKVKQKMEQTSYRCAIGVSFADDTVDIDTMYKRADEKMYADKMQMKSGRNYREKER